MVLAPFSEINGRRPIFVSSGLVFTGQLPSLSQLAMEKPKLISMVDSVLDRKRRHGVFCWHACGQVLSWCWRM